MVSNMSQLSDIQEFFNDSTVFLTGSTGFVGKLLLEKLLRGCPGIRQVYILVRIKKGKLPEERLRELLECPIFEQLKRANYNFAEKITIMNGDCAQPNLSLGEQDVEIITNEVNCIIHCAATVRFDQKLSQATKINVRASRDLVEIAKKTRDLRSFVYVSTAFSNCDRKEIDEVFYPPKIDADNLIAAVEALDDIYLDDFEKRLMGDLPNTYTLTKQVCEDMLKKKGKDLPLCIVRPSIIIASADEPLKGYIDNYYGPTGLFAGGALGLLRSVRIKRENTADVVPVDYVVNCILAAAYYVSRNKIEDEPKVFNFVSSADNPVKWKNMLDAFMIRGWDYSSPLIIWYPFAITQPNPYIHAFLFILLHTIPGYIVDFLAVCMGKKPQLVEIYTKLRNAQEVISYFPMRQWDFRNKNAKQLWKSLSPKDRVLFNFDTSQLDWEEYFIFYMKGMRVYLVKDPMDTLEEGKRHVNKLLIMHYTLCTVVLVLLFFFLRFVLSFVFY